MLLQKALRVHPRHILVPRSGIQATFRTRAAVCMGLVETVSEDMKSSMKSREADRTQVLRSIRATFINKMKENGSETLRDADAIVVLKKLAKQYRESIEVYKDAGRLDLVAQEEAGFKIVATYLPQLADEATTRRWVEQAIESSGVTEVKGAGKVMGSLMKEHKSEIEPELAKRLINELLAQK